jgi:4-alpha-glucanotransferase
MLRLLALESHRHQAIVIGEDLGTLPEGFQGEMARAGILGMRVLWFEQEQGRSFRPPHGWSPDAAAMTTTHDLPTITGWWRGLDIGWRDRLGLFPAADTAKQEQARRAEDRSALWRAFLDSGAATGDEPGPDDAESVVEAAIGHMASASSIGRMASVQDALALPEQPNLPGTTEGHPNWQRRMPGNAAHLLDDPAVARRIEILARARPKGE